MPVVGFSMVREGSMFDNKEYARKIMANDRMAMAQFRKRVSFPEKIVPDLPCKFDLNTFTNPNY
jgi:hypothetical protein